MHLNWEIIKGFFITLKRPLAIVLESSNQCNANCTMCSRDKLKREQEVMDYDLFVKVIDDAVKVGIGIFQLSFYGESLLDPKLVDKVKYIYQKLPTAVVQVVTNGSLLTEEKTTELLEAGISEIRLSIEGNNEEEYNKIRVGLDYNEVLENIKRLRLLRDSDPKYKTQIVVTGLHLLDYSIKIEEYKKFWSQYADIVYTRDEYLRRRVADESLISKILPCEFLFIYLPILADGSYPLCIYDWYGETIYGNIRETSITQAWFGKKIILYKFLHLIGLKRKIKFCKDCDYRTNYRKFLE